MTMYKCRYVCNYEDGIALSSDEHYFKSAEERMNFLKEDYDDDEINIDTSKYEYGWEFEEVKL